ncbi:MAG: hypothetical protein LJF06_10395, partial [Gemmatimonadetes bacterium]|nr:hypothetical protein [Gemmatimonadota bacterium]
GGADGWLLELGGEAGRSYDLRLYGAVPRVGAVTGAVATLTTATGTPKDPHVLHVTFPQGVGRKDASIRLTAGGTGGR